MTEFASRFVGPALVLVLLAFLAISIGSCFERELVRDHEYRMAALERGCEGVPDARLVVCSR